MDWSNYKGDNKTEETKSSISDTRNQSSFKKPPDEVKYRRVSESAMLHGKVCPVVRHVKRRVLNGGVSPVCEETYTNLTLDSENSLYRSRSQTPTRELSRHKTRVNQAKRHSLPTWDIIDTDADR